MGHENQNLNILNPIHPLVRAWLYWLQVYFKRALMARDYESGRTLTPDFVWIKYQTRKVNLNVEGCCLGLVMGWMLCGWHTRIGGAATARTLCQAKEGGSQALLSRLRARISGVAGAGARLKRPGSLRVWGTGSVQAVRQLPSSHQPENIGPCHHNQLCKLPEEISYWWCALRRRVIYIDSTRLGCYESIQSYTLT